MPHAELFVSVRDRARHWAPPLGSVPIHESWLSRLPGASQYYPRLLPLMDGAFRHFDMSRFDLIVSSNHACAKNVVTPAGTRHVCYCHTPMRYVWDPSFLDGENLGPVGTFAFEKLLGRLRRTDLRGATQPDTFVANSRFVAQRILDCYGRDAQVIHPPVDVDRFSTIERRADADAPYLVFGRVVPYKRVDVAVRACARIGRPLIVAGEGRDLDRVRALAGPQTTFLGPVRDERVARAAGDQPRAAVPRRGGLRDRPGRGPGGRPAGRRAEPRRRARLGRRRRRPACCTKAQRPRACAPESSASSR